MSLTSISLDAFAPAHVMLSALAERRASSAELVELHLERIRRYNDALNAIVVPGRDPQSAARQADLARASGEQGALLGLPVTLKESMNVPGLATTVGVPDFKDFVAADYGAIPQRVLGAGAVLLGKTNVPPMLADWQSTNPIYGRTVNPWNAALTPGGSTGGTPTGCAQSPVTGINGGYSSTPTVTASGGVSGGAAGGGGATGDNGGRLYANV